MQKEIKFAFIKQIYIRIIDKLYKDQVQDALNMFNEKSSPVP